MRLSVGIKLGFWLALFGSLSIGLFGYYIFVRSQDLLIQSSKDKLLTASQVFAHRLTDALTDIAADIKFIKALPQSRQIIEHNPESDKQAQQQLAQVFASLLSSRPEYAQVRLIDAVNHGKELVRVDRDLTGIKIISGQTLQEKNHFPYVFETLLLPAGQLYVSDINLNQELGAHLGFGQPTIRIATKIQSQSSDKQGVIVINVNLDDLFNQIRDDLPANINALLTNIHGDYLIHPNPNKTFAFEQGRQFLIQDDIAVSQVVLDGKAQNTVTITSAIPGGTSLAAFVRVPLGDGNAHRMVMLGLYTPLESVLAESEILGFNVIQVTALFGVLAVLVSLILARILAQPLNQMTKTVSQFKLGMPLPNLPSQRNDEIGYLASSFSTMVTNLNQQVAALHASETKLQTILDNIPLGIWLIGIDGQSRFLNKTFQEALGMSEEEFFNAPHLSKFLTFDDTRSTALSTDHEPEVLTYNDGSQHILDIKKVKLLDRSGAIAALIGIAIDITERKHAEQILRSSEEKLRTMFELSPLGMAQNTMDGRYIEANKALLDMVGYSLEELNSMSYWALTPQDYEPQELAQLQSLSDTGKYGPYEKEYLHRDGHKTPIRLNGVLIKGSDGQQYIWSIVENITQQKQSEQLIWEQANFDPLTGLPNRRMLHDRLAIQIKKAHRRQLPLALIFLDLDRFKEVNDTLGHAMGDLLLVDAAHRLLSCVRESDTVARLGGDEFTLILDELDDISSVERVIQNILQKLAEPFQLKDKQAFVSASIGVTIYPKDGDDKETLIKNADQAMYTAKQKGRNRYSFFTASMQEAAMIKMQTAIDLRHALAANQFKLYYQPIVQLQTGRLQKAEALLRWEHPTNSLLFNPNNFISIAEDIGIIGEIGDWVFTEATRQVAKWRAHYDPAFQVSINKSPLQFFKGINQHRLWLDHLQALGLPGDCVVIEITEGLLLEASLEVSEILSIFRQAGIQVSLDDFGTGYSALAYLKKFHIDYIKIDRSFVSHLSAHSNDMTLCEAIIAMAHKLGIKVIAEGIETTLQRNLLLEAGCDYGQGYLFAKPLPIAEFEQLLSRQTSAIL
ncbi:MAG: EAL domain-containing protein [Methylomonas sp.]|jgi:diguanylate cyclase (GGDEF)-like protein/PAS domain S-box-containing protein|uniref:bifunctional diguanylate cyclase/phosphodiesterase n=1 Tax=Methylomonas sp. TaxID=418 RepID=UPI0025E652E4|nr:EAL domain-containing protein [Methylomonas sp.]MCK9608730.1 EAL domain-containing protein [Methylomonas sp.]